MIKQIVHPNIGVLLRNTKALDIYNKKHAELKRPDMNKYLMTPLILFLKKKKKQSECTVTKRS